MNRNYTYVSYEDIGQSGKSNFEHDAQVDPDGIFPSWYSGWLNLGNRTFRALPWIGAAAVAIGVLVMIFPMLLVMAVAGLFFTAGVICLGLWWRLRTSDGQTFSGSSAWDRFEGWF